MLIYSFSCYTRLIHLATSTLWAAYASSFIMYTPSVVYTVHLLVYEYSTTEVTFTYLFQNIEEYTKDLKWYGHTVIDIFKKYAIFLTDIT